MSMVLWVGYGWGWGECAVCGGFLLCRFVGWCLKTQLFTGLCGGEESAVLIDWTHACLLVPFGGI